MCAYSIILSKFILSFHFCLLSDYLLYVLPIFFQNLVLSI